LSVDPGKPFPFLSNLSLSLGIKLRHPITDEFIFSRVKIPDIVNSCLILNEKKDNVRVINKFEVVMNNLSRLYPEMKIEKIMPFRITRNADWEHDDEDVEDLMESIEEAINERRLQEPIRLECYENYDSQLLDYLMENLDLDESDIYTYSHHIDFKSFSNLCDMNRPDLLHPDWKPLNPSAFDPQADLFDMIKEKDRLVHHPYENFSTSVERFIKISSRDPSTVALKMTLYRTGDRSGIVNALIDAAMEGKQVVCLVELKARFDEKRNIFWAQKMERAGVHVVYGVVGLKTHTKIAMVVRKEESGKLLRYCHIGTGNYNANTSKLYTDLGLFTCDQKINEEVNEVFNYLTGTSLKINYKKLLVAPINMKSTFLKRIDHEIKNKKQGKTARIIAKMNQLDDVEITTALYEASLAGVEVILIVRGFCSLKAGVKNLSENIKVISIIGRFLEHSRVFYFANGQDEMSEGIFYLGSADWMRRNLHSRVEVITPIDSLEIKKELSYFLTTAIKDNRNAWDMMSDGTYIQRYKKGARGTHEKLMKYYLQKVEEASLNTFLRVVKFHWRRFYL
jgi:polyphosphate kinase